MVSCCSGTEAVAATWPAVVSAAFEAKHAGYRRRSRRLEHEVTAQRLWSESVLLVRTLPRVMMASGVRAVRTSEMVSPVRPVAAQVRANGLPLALTTYARGITRSRWG